MSDNSSLQFVLPQHQQSIIKVIGVGGGGSNAVEHMYEQGIKDVEFIVCNTDRQAIQDSCVTTKIQIGLGLTEGLGAGADPEVGRNAALENKEEIRDLLSEGTKMLFITAGMGGGTGTGAAPVIAQIAKDLGILTIGIVTAPFKWEGRKKTRLANQGVEELKATCDAVLVVLNDKLKEVYPEFGMSEAFGKADDVLTNSAKSIAEIITKKIKVNVDFNDVHKVMFNAGTAVMGTAIIDFKEGVNIALEAGKLAIQSPLLNNADIAGAEKILLTITHGENIIVSMEHFEDLQDFIMDQVGEEVEDEVIFGFGTDSDLGNQVKVTIVATGFQDKEYDQKPKYVNLNSNKTKTEISSKPLQKRIEVEKEPIEPIFETPKEKPSQIDIFNPPTPERNISLSPVEKPFNREAEEMDNLQRKENEEALKRKIAKQRQAKLQSITTPINNPLTDQEISEKLKTPAYKRKNVNLNDQSHSSENEISRFTLNEDDEILGNNRFLHDNVD